jgi:hypothetical protein
MTGQPRVIQRQLQRLAVVGFRCSRYAWLVLEPGMRAAYRTARVFGSRLREQWNGDAGFVARCALFPVAIPAVCSVLLFLYFQHLSAGPMDDAPRSIIAFRWPVSSIPIYHSLDEARTRSRASLN